MYLLGEYFFFLLTYPQPVENYFGLKKVVFLGLKTCVKHVDIGCEKREKLGIIIVEILLRFAVAFPLRYTNLIHRLSP